MQQKGRHHCGAQNAGPLIEPGPEFGRARNTHRQGFLQWHLKPINRRHSRALARFLLAARRGFSAAGRQGFPVGER
ncbi:MAG: hypothetical protein OEV81_09470, partial [Betaproteobacteria bacterium]|nr:hypothetical protein [Betaproteobacteria bacterium]